MVMNPQQPGALLIAVIIRHGPRAGIGHVGYIFRTDASVIRARLSCGGNPLMGRAVADPRGFAAMEVKNRPVLRIGVAVRACARPHGRGVNRDKKIAIRAGGKLIGELDAHGPVFLGNNQRPKILDRRRIYGVLA